VELKLPCAWKLRVHALVCLMSVYDFTQDRDMHFVLILLDHDWSNYESSLQPCS
jgi:hypothetical protein